MRSGLSGRRAVVAGSAVLLCAPALARGGAAAAKADVLALARRLVGRGDPDGSLQRRLDPLVARLLEAAPQPPVRERLGLLAGAWRQVWGPYDYRRPESRGVDPRTDPDHIFQVVAPGGHYWNVAPRDVREGGSPRRIVLLRGVWRVAPEARDVLAVRFTRLVRARTEAALSQIWRLAPMAEARAPGFVPVVPGVVVRTFFPGGGLREAYTDRTLRIAYGAYSVTDRRREFAYVMERAG